jgi:hypothetical protein
MTAALEALGAGDVLEASAILRSALRPRRGRPVLCPFCDVSFAWWGELDHHLHFSHEVELEATV